MIVKRLVLKNWMCFRGTHALDLEAKAYAVICTRVGNVESSNWGGKTALLEAVVFALTGVHPHDFEDGWISNGEPIGGVELVASAAKDVRLLRERHRGRRTVLHVDVGDRHMMGDEAQAYVYDMLGLSEQDFRATCWFEQRQMARLVLASPADRMKLVGGWLELDPLERCSQNAGRRLRKTLDEVGAKLAAIRAREDLLAQIMRTPDGSALTLDRLKAHFLRCYDAAKEAAERYDQEEEIVQENERHRGRSAKKREYEEAVAEFKRYAATFAFADEAFLVRSCNETHTQLTESMAHLNQCTADLGAKSRLAAGEFDGICPVAQIMCPARSQINADRIRGSQLRDEAREALRTAEGTLARHRAVYHEASEKAEDYRRKKQRYDDLQKRAADLFAHADAPEFPLRESNISVARDALELARTNHLVAEQAFNQAVKLTSEVEESKGERGALEARLVHLRAAVQLFGKNGSQRALAEGVLGTVEEDANAALAEAGVDLSVAVRWGREGSGPAKSCDACGEQFPPSAKVKECGRCGAARGPHVTPRLDIIPSNRSGAADDLAGAFTQLAAAKWLKRERGSAWGCALLDELWGQLDAPLRRALTSHVAGLLRDRYGFPQALVVAHHAAVLDSLPGRILVERDGDWAAARVVS